MPGNTHEEAEEKRKLAHMLNLAGLTWQEVASHDFNGAPLYAHAASAHAAAKQYRESNCYGDNLLEQRELDMHRFDALQRAMWRKAIQGDLPAAKFVLSLMVAREKLLGTQGVQPPTGIQDPLDELAKKREAS